MKKIMFMACCLFLLAACASNAKKNSENASDSTAITNANTEVSATSAVAGTYKGVFPAADCPGIETTLTLKADNTYTMLSVYIDRNSNFDEKGTYAVNDTLLTLKSDGNETSYYKIGKNELHKLMADKQEITGELADHYILNKEQ